MLNKARFLLLFACCLLLTAGLFGEEGKLPTADYNINWWVVDGGGMINSSTPSYRAYGAVGQSFIGYSEGGANKLYSGFFHPGLLPTEVKEIESPDLPTEFKLTQNYPNPFNPATVIEYSLPKSAHVTIEIYNLLGQKVNILVDEDQKVGSYRVDWDGKDKQGGEMASGIYFYRIQAGGFVKCKKMILLK